ncbi:hypothetical protein [Mucilaginibacter flavus]|uniref:hypothetical protein n=1 Tax=Mucilaginibacter flavus TaxID=931504 RepID=UPI0025B45356|nr:hypothetical protein [Mucilaginibacter flavus]MDN3579932.1 hypothetical protein [Mucilaginibacter flavus]
MKILRLTPILLFICLFKATYAQAHVTTDSLTNYVLLQDQEKRETKVIKYIKTFFQSAPLPQLEAKKAAIADTFTKYNLEHKESIIYFMESIFQRRLSKLPESQNALVKAIDEAHKDNDHLLLFDYFTHLAFVQTDEGNSIGAVSSYGWAKKEVEKLNNPYLEALLNVNISDIYYKSGLYSQSLSYLDQAQRLIDDNKIVRLNILSLITYNKAENYFRTKNYDSLKLCHEKLLGPKNQSYKLHTYQKRTGYYLSLLKHDYKGAIDEINALFKDKQYVKSELEEQLLARAYLSDGEVDSAKVWVDRQLDQQSKVNHPEIKYQLYEMLAQIAEHKNDDKLATNNYKMALGELKQNIANLSQVGDKSSQIKINEVQNLYYVNLLKYQRERLWMLFAIALAVIAVIIVAIFYRSSRQKRHYEQLLFAAKKQELATINSHEVRNHLSNILGLLDLSKDVETKEELLKIQRFLQHSAEELDKNLKNVSEKLSEKD